MEKTGQKVDAPIDFSFRELKSLGDVVSNNSGTEQKDDNQPSKPRVTTGSIRFCNNYLESIADLSKVFSFLNLNPKQIAWIDISFNKLTKIDESILLCPNLKVLYLHANQIENISEVDKLGQLVNLKNLTLHGNPMESIKGYRYLVLAKIPQIKHLDFSGITKADRTVVQKH